MSENDSLTGSVAGRLDSLLDVKTDDPVRLRRGRLVNVVLLVSFGATLLWLVVTGVASFFAASGGPEGSAYLASVFSLVVIAATYGLNRRAASPAAGLVLALAVLAGTVVLLTQRGPQTASVIGLTVPVIIAGLLGPPVAAFGLATLAAVAFAWLNLQRDPSYFSGLLGGVAEPGAFIVYLDLAIIAAMTWLFSRMAGRAIRESHAEIQSLLEQRAQLEGRLERQTLGLKAATGVARALAELRGLDEMLADMTTLVRDFYEFDSVRVFLIDEGRSQAALRAVSGELGQKPLPQGYSVPLGATSIVSRAAEGGEPLIGRGSGAGGAKSDVALPLAIGDDVVGVLHLLNAQPYVVETSDLPGLRALADQLAVAVANARSYDEAQRNIRELNELSRVTTQRGWQEYLYGKSPDDLVFQYGAGDSQRQRRQTEIVGQVVRQADAVSSRIGKGDNVGYLAVPMTLRNEVIGVIGVEADDRRRWTKEDVQVLRSIADRTALAVENRRLLEQAQHSAGRQELVNTIASRLQRAQDLETLLQGAAQELGAALGTDQVYAEFSLSQPEPPGDEQESGPKPPVVPDGDEPGDENGNVGSQNLDGRRNSQ